MTVAKQEKDKYTKAWDHDAYRTYAPGEQVVMPYLAQCHPKKGRWIDFGTGTGRAAKLMHDLGYDVAMIDIADNCLDKDVAEVIGNRLLIANLWDTIDLPQAPEGFCTDVMEHIPPQYVEDVVSNCLGLCDRVFFHICLREDHFGKELGEHLHLTVKPFKWWRDLLGDYGQLIEARDLLDNGWYYVNA